VVIKYTINDIVDDEIQYGYSDEIQYGYSDEIQYEYSDEIQYEYSDEIKQMIDMSGNQINNRHC